MASCCRRPRLLHPNKKHFVNYFPKYCFIFRSLLTVPLWAGLPAQAAGAAPDSGSILQQLQPAAPAEPSSSAPLQLESFEAAQPPASAPFQVNAIRIVGNAVFGTEALHALVADREGGALTLAQLGELASRITDFYRQRGFPLARAIVPAQTIRDGAVVLEVIEARYGQIRFDGDSAADDALLKATVAPLREGGLIAQPALDRALLLLSDVPGVGINAVIKPGTSVGTADLDIRVKPGAPSSAEASLDNYGNRYTGRARLGGAANIFNPLRHGDILSASVVSSGSDMNYGRVSYETLLNGQGLRAGASYSAVQYRLGGDLASLGAQGTANVASLWIRYPLLRSQQANLYARLGYDAKRLRDRVDSTDIDTDRHIDNLMLNLNGDVRDNWLGGGVSLWSAGLTEGRLAFDNADAESSDAASAETRGRFTKWNAQYSRVQTLSAKDSLWLNVSAQWAGSNLDTSEKILAGGPTSVRAYDSGAVSADSGYIGTLELRRELGAYLSGSWQATAFVDTARVTINHRSWAAGDNTASLSGAGVGLNWTGPATWRASVSVAARIGAAPSVVSDAAAVRGWVTLNKSF